MKSLQLDKPHAIVTIGIKGSGKTFFAGKFSEMLNAPFIHQSVIEKHTASESDTETMLMHMIDELVKTRHTFVLEIDMASKTKRLELANKLRRAGYVPLFVWVQVDVDTAMLRSKKSKGIQQSAFEAQLQKFSPPTSAERVVVISGKHTYATQARIILKKLSGVPHAPITHVPIKGPPTIKPQPPARGQITVQ